MIIVSQNTTSIVNFERLCEIRTYKNDRGKYNIMAYSDYDSFLGEYATKERALKVLAEILLYYKDEGITGSGNHFSDRKVIYNMPKE
jgi:hypothetical protein